MTKGESRYGWFPINDDEPTGGPFFARRELGSAKGKAHHLTFCLFRGLRKIFQVIKSLRDFMQRGCAAQKKEIPILSR